MAVAAAGTLRDDCIGSVIPQPFGTAGLQPVVYSAASSVSHVSQSRSLSGLDLGPIVDAASQEGGACSPFSRSSYTNCDVNTEVLTLLMSASTPSSYQTWRRVHPPAL